MSFLFVDIINRPANIGELSSGSYPPFPCPCPFPNPSPRFIPSLPTCPFPHPPSPFPILFPAYPYRSNAPPIQIQLGVWGNIVSSPAGVGRARPLNAFWCSGGQNWAHGTRLRALQNGLIYLQTDVIYNGGWDPTLSL